MATTSKSLLFNARKSPQSEAWFVINEIYEPLIAGWVVRAGVASTDVSDITQEVLETLTRKISSFEHNGRVGAFRNWLKVITVNRCRRHWERKKREVPTQALGNEAASARVLSDLEDPHSDLSALWKAEHDNYVLERVRLIVQKEFSEQEYEVFLRNTVEGETPKEISADLGVTASQIYKIKFRVLQRLKEVAEGLLDEPFGENHC